MHNNYYFLKHLSKELGQRLTSAKVQSCFTQNKNELIIIFDALIIKANLSPSFCCLSFPNDFHRARKNSVDLFTKITDLSVLSVTQYSNERCFSIDLDNNFQLLFKMHGNRSNIILMEDGVAGELFINKLAKDEFLKLNNLNRPIDQSKSAFESNNGDIKVLYPTFGKEIKKHLEEVRYNQMPVVNKWSIVENLITQLEDEKFYVVHDANCPIELTLLSPNLEHEVFHSPIEAINFFYITYISESTLNHEKSAMLQRLITDLKRVKNYIAKSEKKLEQIQNSIKYNHLADIIMANLHNIKTGLSSVQLPNFYDNNDLIEIKLKKGISPQQNAETYYKKAKNQNLEVSVLEENIANKMIQQEHLTAQLETIKTIDNLKELRNYIKTNNLEKEVNQASNTSRPFHQQAFMGFDILIGKSAKANDDLIRSYTYKEDLWLHAKDVSGSHVIIKYQSGKEFPPPVIEKAAQLAAYFSKRKQDTLCPVIYTPRKFIRKRKNDPPGAVVVEREQVIMVEPGK